MLKIKHLFSLMTLLLFSVWCQAQGSDIEMADGMRASGKIYVVVTVLSIIFIGIVAFLIRIDGKVKALETEVNNKK